MKKLYPSSQFKKDYKRYKNNLHKLRALSLILELLKEEKEIPKTYKPHFLKGEYQGCLECHIENDFLLIWIEKDVIELVRLGSHSELFK